MGIRASNNGKKKRKEKLDGVARVATFQIFFGQIDVLKLRIFQYDYFFLNFCLKNTTNTPKIYKNGHFLWKKRENFAVF